MQKIECYLIQFISINCMASVSIGLIQPAPFFILMYGIRFGHRCYCYCCRYCYFICLNDIHLTTQIQNLLNFSFYSSFLEIRLDSSSLLCHTTPYKLIQTSYLTCQMSFSRIHSFPAHICFHYVHPPSCLKKTSCNFGLI